MYDNHGYHHSCQYPLSELKLSIPRCRSQRDPVYDCWYHGIDRKAEQKSHRYLPEKDIAMFSGLQQDFDISKARNELGFNPKSPEQAVRKH